MENLDPEGGWRPERCEEPGTGSISWRREDVVWSRRGSRWPYAQVGQPKLPGVFHRRYRLWFAPDPQ